MKANTRHLKAGLTLFLEERELVPHVDVEAWHLEGAYGQVFLSDEVSFDARCHGRSEEAVVVL